MLLETLQSAVDFASRGGGEYGIIFFGGEPLLQKELIYQAVDYAEFRAKKSNTRFHYKITTNGLLLDDGKYAIGDVFKWVLSVAVAVGR